MASQGDINVTVSSNWIGFKQGLDEARAHAKAFGKSVQTDVAESWTGAGKSIVASLGGYMGFQAVKDFIGSIFSRVGELKDMSEQFDISTDSVQEWEKALRKAGLSTNLFFRALETLRTKRAEALETPSKMGAFSRLGLEGMARGAATDVELLRAMLGSGASRVELNEMLGRGGGKLRATLPFLGGQPLFSEQDVEDIDKAGKFWQNIKDFARAVGAKILMTNVDFKGMAEKLIFLFNPTLAAKRMADRLANEQTKKNAEAKARADEQRELSIRAQIEDEQRADEEAADRNHKLEAAQQKLKDVRRKGMTPGEQKVALRGELELAQERIQFWQDLQDLDPSYKLKFLEAQTKAAELRNELNPLSKGPDFGGGDSLARLGIFTQAGLLYAPGVDINRQQLEVLRRIETNTRQTIGDPLAP